MCSQTEEKMSRATEASLNESKKRREELRKEMQQTRLWGKGTTSSSTYHKSGLRKSSYKENPYSE